MQNKLTIDWLIAALIRAVKTTAQTALGMFTVGAALYEVKWEYVISVSLVSGIYSILTSLATGLPEAGTDGTLQIDTTSEDKDVYRLELNDDPQILSTKKSIRLSVDPNAKLD